jgi:hemoglobin-like flavoprotein
MKTLSPQEIEILERTLHDLRRDPIRASQIFYTRLFKNDPSLFPLLSGSFDLAGSRLLRTLKAGIGGLKDPGELVGLLTFCARPAIRQRLLDGESMRAVGDALMAMLEEHLGEEFTPDARTVWRSAYLALCRTLENGLSRSPDVSDALSLDALREPRA